MFVATKSGQQIDFSESLWLQSPHGRQAQEARSGQVLHAPREDDGGRARPLGRDGSIKELRSLYMGEVGTGGAGAEVPAEEVGGGRARRGVQLRAARKTPPFGIE